MLPACIIGLLFLFPLYSDEVDEDFFDDDMLLIENEGITVTGSPETTQQMVTVTKEEIDRIQAPDLATLLQETAGLGFTRYGPYGNQTGINLRGFDSERVAFLIDGVPVNSPMSGDFEINQLNLDAIDRIEIIYGGSDSKYNVTGALGGVINIITVKKQKPGWSIGASLSNTGYRPKEYYIRGGETGEPEMKDLLDTQSLSFSLGHGSEIFSWRTNLFGNRAGNHYPYKDNHDRDRRKENNEVLDGGASTSLIWALPDLTKVIFSGDIYYGDKNIPTGGYSFTYGTQDDFSTRQNILLDMPRAFRDDLSTEFSLSHGWTTIWFEPAAGASSTHDQHVITTINRWAWFPLSFLTVRVGGDYRYVTLDSTEMLNKDRHDGGVYLTLEYQPHTKFLIIPSIKGVFDPNSAVPVPKLGFVWYATDDLTIKNNYFRSFKFPDFEALYWPRDAYTQGNPDLKPEDGWGTDLIFAYRFKKWVNLESTLFAQMTDDSIHWSAGGDGIWKPYNVGKADFFGWDSKAGIDIPLAKGPFKKIGVNLSYQFLLSYILSYGYTWSDEKRIPYMPMHTIGVSLDIPWEIGSASYGGSILITGRHESLRYSDTQNITEVDFPVLIDIIINQKLGNVFTAFASARNILDISYESFDEYPMPGITVTLGLRFNIEGKRHD